MYSEIKITNHSDVAVIDIDGMIGVSEKMQFRQPAQRIATYARFREALTEIEALQVADIVVNIRSTGGDVNDAVLIYEALRGLPARITTRCFGYVASAATIIAQAATSGRRELSVNTLYLIHCSEANTNGNTHSLTATRELLAKTDHRIAKIYAESSGLQPTHFERLMAENSGRGRWLTADEAIEAGLADCIISAADEPAAPPQNNAQMAELCALLGLPEIPQCTDRDDITLWQRIVNFVRQLFGYEDEKEVQLLDYQLHIDDAKPQSATTAPRFSHIAQLASSATTTDPTEDLFEYRPTANEQAYINDIQTIRMATT